MGEDNAQICCYIYAAMCSLTSLDQSSGSHQHADTSLSQARCDCSDISKLVAWLSFCDVPIEPDEDLELFIPWMNEEII